MSNANLLQQAWDVYYAIATHDDRRISGQSYDYESAPESPYDYAALMVKSLIRVVYPAFDPALVWELFGEAGECLDQADLERGLADRYARQY
ncbi:hypothetical protein SSEA_SKINNY_154 [Mycobacterium phage Skinny]|uniref:Uncharacterized protein n=1 Tax=Mycobacterium phage Bricole TaxID=1718601 RepID=A0A0M4S3D6_9CAUD|nr:hypothetical protein SEA_BRICOLE_153 [Mycobacterium phage Bricole]QUU29331.1 hypothetical protein [Mycobacterium phage SirSheldon]UXE05322.1 hypothetical protein SSEA_SKINNY_154 [Mycobacterium phage Skinny]